MGRVSCKPLGEPDFGLAVRDGTTCKALRLALLIFNNAPQLLWCQSFHKLNNYEHDAINPNSLQQKDTIQEHHLLARLSGPTLCSL